jgi:tetratricopeptide (TPR) repeat protein
VFLKIGAENGAIAMGAFILFLFSILYAWWKSFRGMVDEDRALSWVIGVSVAGAFAHSMIDYNLNFVANLLLLFLLLAFFRSLSVGVGVGAGVGEQKSYTKKPVAVRAKLLLAGLVFVLAAYESGVLVLSQIDEDAREWSLYPRNYYLNLADEALQNGEFNQVEELALKQVELNPYDGQSWYLLGATYFSAVNPEFNEMKAAEYFNEAIQVNPFNDLNYYREYLSALISFGDQGDIERLRSGLLALLADYEVLIKYNVHFTTYTPNADAAVDLYRILAMYFPEPNSGAVPYDHMFGEGNVNAELMQKADDLQDIIDEIRASRKL